MTAYNRAAVALALSASAAMMALFWTYGGPQVRLTLGVLTLSMALLWWRCRETPAERAERVAHDIQRSYGSGRDCAPTGRPQRTERSQPPVA